MQRRQGAEDHKFHLVSRLGTSPRGLNSPTKAHSVVVAEVVPL